MGRLAEIEPDADRNARRRVHHRRRGIINGWGSIIDGGWDGIIPGHHVARRIRAPMMLPPLVPSMFPPPVVVPRPSVPTMVVVVMRPSGDRHRQHRENSKGRCAGCDFSHNYLLMRDSGCARRFRRYPALITAETRRFEGFLAARVRSPASSWVA